MTSQDGASKGDLHAGVKIVQDATVFVLNTQGVNRWWATVQPGFDDSGKRISEQECEEVAMRLAALPQAPAADSPESRMLLAACADLGLINEALGLDPDDGGAEPILEAIAELKAQAPAEAEAPQEVPADFVCLKEPRCARNCGSRKCPAATPKDAAQATQGGAEPEDCGICKGDPESCDIHDCGQAHRATAVEPAKAPTFHWDEWRPGIGMSTAPMAAEPVAPASDDGWPAYIAGIIETYLGFGHPPGDARIEAIASIIRRRMWIAPKPAAPAKTTLAWNPDFLAPVDAAEAVAEPVEPAQATPAAAVPKRLTSMQIRAGWEDTFSTNNPFCPCDLKSFTKAVTWTERALAAAQPFGEGKQP